MNKAKKQRTWGLIGLYICLLIISSLIQQIAYLGVIAVVLLIMVIIILVALWRHLLRNKLITVAWNDTTDAPVKHRSERLFLFSIVTLVSPILRLHHITLHDVAITAIAILIFLIGFKMNERRLNRKVISKKEQHQ